MRLDFGKFKGETLSSVPLSYLAWLHDQEFPSDELRAELKLEIARRIGATPRDLRSLAALPDRNTLEAARELIRAGFRSASKRAHPDAGGSHAAMVATTRARECLDALVRESAA